MNVSPAGNGNVELRPLAAADAASAASVWNATFGDVLPADPEVLAQLLASPHGDPELQWLAVRDGRAVGFAWGRDGRAPWAAPGVGYLSALAVAPNARGQGIGDALWRAVVDPLRARGCHTVRLGTDADPLLPGIPASAPPATWRFFLRRGARFGGAEFDLHVDLQDDLRASPGAATDAGVFAPDLTLPGGITLAADADAALTFVAQAFPGRWHEECRRYAEEGVPLLALLDGARPIGFCAVFPPELAFVGPSLTWRRALGERTAGLGPIGIASDRRGEGIGRAFVAAACRWLQERGAEEVVINWTTLAAFYGTVGARVWRTYQRAEVPLDG